jgi:hypothetical protein
MTAREILDLADVKRVRLWTDGTKLRWQCRGGLPDELRQLLVDHKPALLAALRLPGPCPNCGRDRDRKGRCWTCFDRPCVGCGRHTGSAFIATCISCGNGPNEAAIPPDGANPA